MYLNVIQIAESFGVSERVIEYWIREEGLPNIIDRGRRLFDRAQVVNWAAQRGLTGSAGFLAQATTESSHHLSLRALLARGRIWRGVLAPDVLKLLTRVIASLDDVAEPVRALLIQRLQAPHGINWAPVGKGVALPHFSARVSLGNGAGVIALIFLRENLPLQELAPDRVPVTRLLFFVPPYPRAHLEILGGLSRALLKGQLQRVLTEQVTDDVILRALDTPETLSESEGTP
jgi:PTS system nitrogen regulatory IIA component